MSLNQMFSEVIFLLNGLGLMPYIQAFVVISIAISLFKRVIDR